MSDVWKRSDISDEVIVLCAIECRRQIDAENERLRRRGLNPYSLEECRAAGETECRWRYVDELLAELFGAPEKVIFAAMERAAGRNLIDYGIHIRGAWPTDEGLALVQ